MTKQQKQRRAYLVKTLSDLSRDGWKNAKPCDYLPLEAELRAMGGWREPTQIAALRFERGRETLSRQFRVHLGRRDRG